MNDFISTLSAEFKSNANAKIASEQKAYMRNQFEFFGLKSADRRILQKPFLMKEFLPPKSDVFDLVIQLWELPERDFQLFGQELVFKYVKQFEKNDIEMLEYMVSHKSWWDTVDFIAYKLMGTYFKMYPDERLKHVQKWLQTDNIWLQRSALLFQLKYKEELDQSILTHAIESLLGTNEFFINKAIGWVLREYSRTDAQWVQLYVDRTELSNLSKKEALRLIK